MLKSKSKIEIAKTTLLDGREIGVHLNVTEGLYVVTGGEEGAVFYETLPEALGCYEREMVKAIRSRELAAQLKEDHDEVMEDMEEQGASPCRSCGHKCPTDRQCEKCGSDVMEDGDALCVGCDKRLD